jgi:hypothetical protein
MHLAAPRAIPSNSQMRPTAVDTAPNPAGPGCSSNAYGLISRFSEGIDMTSRSFMTTLVKAEAWKSCSS